MPDVEVVHLQIRDQVAVITLDSPVNRNALSATVRAQLLTAIRGAQSAPGVRALLLTHTGSVFCSGMDLTETHRHGTPGPGLTQLATILLALTRSRLPVVARVAGPARAGGIGLLAAADIVVAAAVADFAFTEVRLGLVPATIMLPVLRRVPVAAVRELMLTGEVFGAARAAAIGLVNRVAGEGPDALGRAVDEVLGALRQGAPAALAQTKALLATDLSDHSEQTYARLVAESATAFAGGEAAEGMRARLERRPPVWTPQVPQQAQSSQQRQSRSSEPSSVS